MRTAEQAKLEINHILESGANDIRILEWAKGLISEACKEQREICANNAKTDCDYIPSKDDVQYYINRQSIITAPEPPLV